jgi:hypothetical protein
VLSARPARVPSKGQGPAFFDLSDRAVALGLCRTLFPRASAKCGLVWLVMLQAEFNELPLVLGALPEPTGVASGIEALHQGRLLGR